MKRLIKVIISAVLFTILFVNVYVDNNNNDKYFLGNFVALNSANAEGGGDLVNCNCGLIWGKSCRADNYGATCWSGDDCTKGNKNCD